MNANHSALAEHASRVAVSDADLQWQEGGRWSARQKTTHPMGGVVGRWTLEGDLGPFAPFLDAGVWTHVGKQAAFGLGRYRLIKCMH